MNIPKGPKIDKIQDRPPGLKYQARLKISSDPPVFRYFGGIFSEFQTFRGYFFGTFCVENPGRAISGLCSRSGGGSQLLSQKVLASGPVAALRLQKPKSLLVG